MTANLIADDDFEHTQISPPRKSSSVDRSQAIEPPQKNFFNAFKSIKHIFSGNTQGQG